MQARIHGVDIPFMETAADSTRVTPEQLAAGEKAIKESLERIQRERAQELKNV